MRLTHVQSLLASAAIALVACSSSYHPEYHPVTVSNFSQNVSYAPASSYGGVAPERPAVIVVPAPPVVMVPGAGVAEVPPEFLR